jgi:glycosyltransferase involved in cell wall biosynthesis
LRVLILTQHFTPEITAARSRLAPIAELLAARGHEVEVLTAVPNHPDGVVQDGFRRRVWVRRELDGFRVRHVWVKASPKKTMRTRLMLYGSYATMAALAGFVSRRPDVIFASSPPLPVAAAAATIAVRHRRPWVMDVRDLWPEAAVALGELSNERVIRAAERLERRLYASAASIVTVTDTFRSDIAAKTDDDAKITVIPNGTTKLWLGIGETEVDRVQLELPADRFIWTYAGNVGIAQGLEAAIDAAAELDDGFQLLVIGNGPVLERIKKQAEGLPPGRVVFHGLVQPELAARYLRASDATLVPLGASPELTKFVPSKLFDCCAVGRPVILAAEGEARRLAGEAEAVYPVPPADPAALAGAVRALREDSALRERLGERGRAFAAEYLRERQIDRLEQVLLQATQKD